MLNSFNVHPHSSELSSEPCTPATANNSNENLDLLLDSGLKAQMATAGEEHNWLIGADRGGDVDELLDQFLEFEDCIDGEGLIPPDCVSSDIKESQESHAGPLEDTCNNIEEEGEEEELEKILQKDGYLLNFWFRVAKTLKWLKTQPFSFTPETPLDLSNMDEIAHSNASSRAASSCKSSRSLTAAFDLAALEPEAFQFAGTPTRGEHQCLLEPGLLSSSKYSVSRSIVYQLDLQYEDRRVEDEDEGDDFLSACSEIGEDAIATAATFAATCPGQLSMSSESSGADSDEMHRSLLKTSMGTAGVSEWLSSG